MRAGGYVAGAGAAIVIAMGVVGCGGHSGASETAPVGHVTIRATPRLALIDRPVTIDITGLPANGAATLRARWRSVGGIDWHSSAPVRAGAGGTVRLSGLDGMRFIWSMTRPNPARSFFGADASRPTVVRLAVAVHGAVLARASLMRAVTTPSVHSKTLNVAKDGIFGFYFAPTGGGRHPAVVAVGGSGGGIPVDMAAMLASHGYPALALAYFAAPGLPRALQRIPLEYFARGVRWLARQPEVDYRHIVVEGVSRGGEAALLIAATFPTLVHGAIGLVPGFEIGPGLGDVGEAAWTIRGKAIPYSRVIPVERIDGPVLTASGGEDAVWSSSVNTDQVELRLRDHHFRFRHERLDFPHAGHDLDVPYKPQADPATFGGTRRATVVAQVTMWQRVLQFLGRMRKRTS
jgi:dienelactone hydrolase